MHDIQEVSGKTVRTKKKEKRRETFEFLNKNQYLTESHTQPGTVTTDEKNTYRFILVKYVYS